MKTTSKTGKQKRISYKEQFELCYLRHQYLRKAKKLGRKLPTREEMEPYEKIIGNFSKQTFYVYKNLFLMIGLDLEDVYNITQMYLVSFLGLFSLETNPSKLEDFKTNFKSFNSILCTENDVLDKNKANFTCFLKQRLQDLVRVCRQKAKNVKGLIPEEFVVFTGSKRPPLDIEELLENHEKYGYRPLDINVFKSVKKKADDTQEGPVLVFNRKWYVCVPLRKKNLTLTDFIHNDADPYRNLCNMNPEDFYESKSFLIKSENFKKSSKKKKIQTIKSFLSENNKNPELKEEIKIAKSYLVTLGG